MQEGPGGGGDGDNAAPVGPADESSHYKNNGWKLPKYFLANYKHFS